MALVKRLRGIAENIQAAVAQVVRAWVRAQGEGIVPLAGARRRERLQEALGARQLQLSGADQAKLAELTDTKRRGLRRVTTSGRAPIQRVK